MPDKQQGEPVRPSRRREETAEKLAEAASRIHHWHDWGREDEGMVVDAESVRNLWAALAAYRKAKGE